MKNGKHLDGPALEAFASGASMPESKFHVVECDECRAKLAAMRWENALFSGELREAGEHRPASGLPAPSPLPPVPLHAQPATWFGSAFSGGLAAPSAVAAVLVLGSAVALAAFLFGNRGGDETAGVQDEPNAVPESVQVAGDGEKKEAKDDGNGKDAARTITWKGKTAKEWLKVWIETPDEAKANGTLQRPELQQAAKRALDARGALVKLCAAALPVLTEALCAKEDQREALAGMIADMRPRTEEIPAFAALLRDEHFHEHFEIRSAAIHALGSLAASDSRAEAALREATKDSDRAVAEAAEQALALVAQNDQDRQAAKDAKLDAALRTGFAAEAAKKWAEAASAYTECIALNPNLVAAKDGLARCRMAMEEPQQKTPAAVPEAAPDGNRLVFPPTYASQASKDAAVAQAKAALFEAQAHLKLAKSDADRFKSDEDLKKGLFTGWEREQAQARLEIANARWEAARAQQMDVESRPVVKDGAQAANEDKANAQAEEFTRLRSEIEKLKEIVQQQKQAVDAARDEQARMRQGPPQGTVLAIKAEEGLVMVSMGVAQGVQAGQVFGVLRDGRPIARLKIEKVYADTSSAKVLRDSLAPGQTVQVHDEVKLPPPRPRQDREGEEGMGMPPMLERGVPGVEGQEGREGQQPRVNRPKRHDNAGEEGVMPPPRGENPQGNDGNQPPPPGDRPKRHDNAGEDFNNPPPPPLGMEGNGQGQGDRRKFPPPPLREGEQGQGDRPPPPHGMMPPDGQPPKCDKDKNGAEEGLEF